MKEAYEELEMEVIEFDGGDIITESDTTGEAPFITVDNGNQTP